MAKNKATLTEEAAERRQAAADILRLLAHGRPDALYTTVMHVSRGGMSRVIKVVMPGIDSGRPTLYDISMRVALVTGRRYSDRHGGVICGGAGMDMGWDLIYTLSRALYSDTETDPGYKLTQRWL